MKMKIRGSIRVKLVSVMVALLVLPSLLIGFISYYSAKDEMNMQGEIILKNSVKMVLQLIDAKQEEVKRGQLSLEEAQEQVKQYLLGEMGEDGTRPINKEIDLGKNGYFIVYDQEGLEVAHPTLEGKNVWDVQDKSGNGFYFVQDQIRKGMGGGGFTKYSWNLPNSEVTAPKISYSEMDTHWGWIVNAGSYMEDYSSGAYSIIKILWISLTVSSVIGGIVIWVFARHISKPIVQITEVVQQISDGNLDVPNISIPNKDEIGILARSFIEMLHSIRSLIQDAATSADRVFATSDSLTQITDETAKATSEVAQAIGQIAESAGEQAKDIEISTMKINELAARIEEVADSVDKMNVVSADTKSLSSQGMDIVGVLIQKAEQSSQMAVKVTNVVMEMDKGSEEIGSITQTIGQIADQTNLLALNAAIEAARAGEAGRGFAVVAEEIRKLAEGSAAAANRVRELIGSMQNQTQNAVEAMEGTQIVVREQNDAVEKTQITFEHISKAIEEMIGSIVHIKQSSDLMGDKKDEITDLITGLAAISEETSAASEQVSASTEQQLAATEEVNQYAQNLKEVQHGCRNRWRSFIWIHLAFE